MKNSVLLIAFLVAMQSASAASLKKILGCSKVDVLGTPVYTLFQTKTGFNLLYSEGGEVVDSIKLTKQEATLTKDGNGLSFDTTENSNDEIHIRAVGMGSSYSVQTEDHPKMNDDKKAASCFVF